MTDTPEPALIPSPDPGLALHQRLLAGDVTAPAEIAEAFLPALIARMQARYGGLDDPHLAATAAVDALLNYLRRPEQYKPEARSLSAFLYMSAVGDLKNELSKRMRERKAQGGKRAVELDALDAEYQIEDDTDLSVEEQVEILLSPVWSKLAELVTDPIDQQIVKMMMDNERATAKYAQVLGLAHLAPEEQAKAVKRHKDRLKKLLQRHLRWEKGDD